MLDALVDLFTMHRDILGRIDAETHLVTLNTQDGNLNIITNYESLANSPCQN